MAVSKVSICNKALTEVGAQPITSLTDDTEQARTINRVYGSALKSVLEECAWNFAIKRKNLTELDVDLDWTYSGEVYVYQKPTDCIKIVDKSSTTSSYRLEGDYIISDTASFGIKYVYYLDDPSKYTAAFIDALIDKLCSEIAYKIVNSASLGKDYLVAYQTVSLPKAMSSNSQVGVQQVPEDDAWVNAKLADGQPNA